MVKKGRGRKSQSRKSKRSVKDLTAKPSAGVEGGAGTTAGKLTFGAPSPRPVVVEIPVIVRTRAPRGEA